MDCAVSTPLPRFSAMLALALCLPAAAQLVDPTQPPPEAMAPSAAGGAASVPPAPSGLQSVLIADKPGGRRVTVINGRTVRLGESIDGAVLIKITPSEVVLKRGKRLETLKLYPNGGQDAIVEKK